MKAASSGELAIVQHGDFQGAGLALSYALFPKNQSSRPVSTPRWSFPDTRSIVSRFIVKDGKTEIILNLPGLLDWSDMGVITGDALAETFCASMQKTILVNMSEWASGVSQPEYPDSWYHFLEPLVAQPFRCSTTPVLRRKARRVKTSRGNRRLGLRSIGSLEEFLSGKPGDRPAGPLIMRIASRCPSCGMDGVVIEACDYRKAWCQLCGCQYRFDSPRKGWVVACCSSR